LSLKTPGVKLLLCVNGKINHMNLEWIKIYEMIEPTNM
jgi:hypothetical protein